jgi:hypothetical protein
MVNCFSHIGSVAVFAPEIKTPGPVSAKQLSELTGERPQRLVKLG